MATTPESHGTAETDDNGPASEFEKAFAEFASPESTPAHAADEGGNDPARTAHEPQSGPGGSDEFTVAADANTPPATQASDEFELDKLPAAARRELERLQHAERSLKGRVSALDRQLHHTRQRPSADAAPAARQTVDNDTGDVLETDEVKALRESYPEIADPLLRIIEGQKKQLEQVTGRFEQIDEDRNSAFLDRQADTLTEIMPDWATYGSDPRFNDWITTQPRHVQEAAQRNTQFIVDAAEAHDVLERFKAVVTRQAPAPATDPRRSRQMNAGRDVSVRAPVTTTGVPDDYETAFAAYSRKADGKS